MAVRGCGEFSLRVLLINGIKTLNNINSLSRFPNHFKIAYYTSVPFRTEKPEQNLNKRTAPRSPSHSSWRASCYSRYRPPTLHPLLDLLHLPPA